LGAKIGVNLSEVPRESVLVCDGYAQDVIDARDDTMKKFIKIIIFDG
jgi:hypothetical protein